MMHMKSLNTEYKNNRGSDAGKAAIWFTVCNYILKGVSLITVPIFTRLLVPEEYGLLAELTAAEEIILMLSNWDISAGAYLKGLYKFDDVDFFSSAAQMFANVTTLCLYFGLMFMFRRYGSGYIFTPVSFLAMFMKHLFYPGYRLWLTRRQSEFAYKPAAAAVLVYGLLVSVIPLYMVLFVKRTAQTRFCTALFVSAVFCIPFYLKNYRFFSLSKNRKQLRDELQFILKYQFPFLLSSLSLVLLTHLDRIIIGRMEGHEQTAYYGAACSLITGLTVLYASAGQAYLPWKYEKLKGKKYQAVKNIEVRLMFGAALITLIFISIAPEAVRVLFPNSYYEAVWCIPALTAGAFFNYTASFFASLETYYEKTKYSAIGMIICSGMNILLNFLLIDDFGYIVCAYTTAFSYLVYMMIHSIFARITIREAGLEVKLYHKWFIILTCLALSAAAAFIMWLYPYPLVRYGFISILILILIWKHNVMRPIKGKANTGGI